MMFLFTTTLVFSQKNSVVNALDEQHNKIQKTLENLVEYIDSEDSVYLSFMDDSIKVERWYANGMMELTLIEIELHGYSYLKRLSNTKFLKLPPEILYQIYKIIKKNELSKLIKKKGATPAFPPPIK